MVPFQCCCFHFVVLVSTVHAFVIRQSQRFRLRYDGMIHIMEIPKARDYDSGTIRVVAKNVVGEAESSATLTVAPRDDWRSRLKQAPKCKYFIICIYRCIDILFLFCRRAVTSDVQTVYYFADF